MKTQIVPPVCPACPSCPSFQGVCANCGGQGGSGTHSVSGNTIVKGDSISQRTHHYDSHRGNVVSTGKQEYYNEIGSGTFKSNADPNTIAGGLTLMQYDTVAGIEDVAKTGAGAITGVAGTIGNTVTGTVGAVGTAVGGGLLGAGIAAGGAFNALKGHGQGYGPSQGQGYPGYVGDQGTAQGAGALQGTAVGTTYGPGNKAVPGTGSMPVLNAPQSMSPKDYYANLPYKETSGFMPVTSDFSAFRH